MSKRKFLSVLAVSAAASAVLGGVPAAVIAATAGGASATTDPAFGGLAPALAAQLSKNADRPVIVVLKNQFGQATAGTPAASDRSAAVSISQSALLTELSEVHATGIKRFTLVNAVAATVSAAEAQRLAANGAVSQVIPDATVSIPASALGLPTANAAPAPAGRPRITPDAPARTTSLPLRNLAGACAPNGTSSLAPEGLGLTSTVSANSNAATARSLGFTGAGVKVAFIADGVDPGNVNFIAKNGKSVFVDYQDFTGDGAGAPTDGGEAFLDANTIAGQGTHTYNLNGFAAQGYPNSCDVKIEGVAPGASLVGLDIFSGDPSHAYLTTNSMIAEAINYAVEHDHVNVINESFGDNEFPDTTQDVIKLFDNAAVAAGAVVAASTGDSGTMSTIGSPATDPAVISAAPPPSSRCTRSPTSGSPGTSRPAGWMTTPAGSARAATPSRGDRRPGRPRRPELGLVRREHRPVLLLPLAARQPVVDRDLRRHQRVVAVRGGRGRAGDPGLPQDARRQHPGPGAGQADPAVHRDRPRHPVSGAGGRAAQQLPRGPAGRVDRQERQDRLDAARVGHPA